MYHVGGGTEVVPTSPGEYPPDQAPHTYSYPNVKLSHQYQILKDQEFKQEARHLQTDFFSN